MATITRVLLTKKFLRQLEKLPSELKQKVIGWIFLVETRGIHEVSKSKGLHDKPLKGNRWGQRSIRLDRVLIELLEVHKHDY